MTEGSGDNTAASAVRPEQPGWEDRLGALVETLGSLYARLDGLGERQAALVEADGLDELLELLAQRQGLIDRIAELAELLRPCVDAWDELSTRMDEGRRRRLREGLDAIDAAGASIARRDEEHRRRLERRRDDVADKLAGVGRARAAVAAYAGVRGTAGARFQDREG